MIEFTGHAIKRYIERVRPTLTRSQARDELERLAQDFGVIQPEQPSWGLRTESDYPAPDAWLICGDVAFPLSTRDAGMFALSAIPRGMLDAEGARRRTEKGRKRNQRQARRLQGRSTGGDRAIGRFKDVLHG